MPNRKKIVADARKEAKRSQSRSTAELNHTPTSPRKMRLVIDLVRGKQVDVAKAILQNSTKAASRTVTHALDSALSNYMQRNQDQKVDETSLFLVEAFVNQGVTVKRMLPAPMGRAYRLRKRSNHVTIVVDEKRAKKTKTN